MRHRVYGKLLVLACTLSLVGGCALFTPPPDPIEVMEAERENLRLYYAVVSDISRPPSGNAGGDAHLAYQVRMATFQGDVDEVAPRTAEAVFKYQASVNQMAFNWVNLLANNPFTNAYAQKLAGGYGGGDTAIYFGNRTARGGGAGGGDKGVVGGASASGDSSFERVYINTGSKSPFQIGDGVQAGGKDSQIQEGDGTQGQVITRPITQPQPSVEGDLNNDSTGFTGAETGDIGL